MTSKPIEEPLDPADIAAASPTAAALLGTAAGMETATGPPSALPVVPIPSGTQTGRYASVGTATFVAEDGTEVVYLRRRVLPDPDRLATTGWERVADGGRADLLADKLLGDPLLAWRLCDANLCDTADELDVVGRRVRVTLPEGFEGGIDA